MEGTLSLGEPVDLDIFTRAASHLRRILESLGLGIKPREVETLDQYLAKRYPTETDAEDAGAEEVEPAPTLAAKTERRSRTDLQGDAGDAS
jgi:hypothetical protein